MASSDRRTLTFILRVWPESEDPEPQVWRGSLLCVQTGEQVYFQTLAGLVEKVAQMIGDGEDRTRAGDGSGL